MPPAHRPIYLTLPYFTSLSARLAACACGSALQPCPVCPRTRPSACSAGAQCQCFCSHSASLRSLPTFRPSSIPSLSYRPPHAAGSPPANGSSTPWSTSLSRRWAPFRAARLSSSARRRFDQPQALTRLLCLPQSLHSSGAAGPRLPRPSAPHPPPGPAPAITPQGIPLLHPLLSLSSAVRSLPYRLWSPPARCSLLTRTHRFPPCPLREGVTSTRPASPPQQPPPSSPVLFASLVPSPPLSSTGRWPGAARSIHLWQHVSRSACRSHVPLHVATTRVLHVAV